MTTERYTPAPATFSEENALFLDVLHEAPLFARRKPARVVGSIFYCLLLAGYSALAIGAPWILHPIYGLISPMLCTCHVFLLLVTGMFQQYLVYQVQKICLQGYYRFSQKLKYIVRIRFAITAYGTAAMLLVMVWQPHITFLSISAILRNISRVSCMRMTPMQVQYERIHMLELHSGHLQNQIQPGYSTCYYESINIWIIMVLEALCAGSFMSLYIGELTFVLSLFQYEVKTYD